VCFADAPPSHRVEQFPKLGAGVALTPAEHHGERPTLAIAGEVQFGREAPSAAPQSLVFGVQEPLFSSAALDAPLAPAACSGEPGSPCRPRSPPTPLRPPRVVFGLRVGQQALPSAVAPPAVEAVEAGLCQGPYLSGRSRQGEPVRSFQRMPLTTVRCAPSIGHRFGRIRAPAARSLAKLGRLSLHAVYHSGASRSRLPRTG
jgi:hypothetical protein